MREKRRFPAKDKEAAAQVKPESPARERGGTDRPRRERPRPGSRRPYDRKREGVPQTAPAAVMPQPAAERGETGLKEAKEKEGFLKRFLKKILKRS